MRRLVAKTVFSGLVTAWRLAGTPHNRCPSFVTATMEGVVRMPSLFSNTFGVLPSMTATQLLVVPRSIPMMPSVVALRALDRLRNALRELNAGPRDTVRDADVAALDKDMAEQGRGTE